VFFLFFLHDLSPRLPRGNSYWNVAQTLLKALGFYLSTTLLTQKPKPEMSSGPYIARLEIPQTSSAGKAQYGR